MLPIGECVETKVAIDLECDNGIGLLGNGEQLTTCQGQDRILVIVDVAVLAECRLYTSHVLVRGVQLRVSPCVRRSRRRVLNGSCLWRWHTVAERIRGVLCR
jgi:hypothetical protein